MLIIVDVVSSHSRVHAIFLPKILDILLKELEKELIIKQ